MALPSFGVPAPGAADTGGVRNQHIFLTYSQCPVPIGVLFDLLKTKRAELGMREVIESHRDGRPHVHFYVQKSPSPLTFDQMYFTDADGHRWICNVRRGTKEMCVNTWRRKESRRLGDATRNHRDLLPEKKHRHGAHFFGSRHLDRGDDARIDGGGRFSITRT